MGNELKVQNSLVVAGPAIISGSLTTIGGLAASGSLGITGSLSVSGSIQASNTITFFARSAQNIGGSITNDSSDNLIITSAQGLGKSTYLGSPSGTSVVTGTSNINFYTGNGIATHQMVVGYNSSNSIGNVGIGTSTPSATLTVKGTGATSSTTSFLVQNTNASASFQIKDNSEVVFATPDYTPNDGGNSFAYLSKTRTGIYVANTANNFGISYEGGQIYANIGHGSGNPTFTPSNAVWTTNSRINALSLRGTNGIFTNGIDKFVAPEGGTDLNLIFGGSTTSSGQGRIIAYGETHNPKRGKLELYSGTDPLYGVISFSPGNTEAARFTPDGRLNIGAITGSAKLLISGSNNSTLLEIDSPTVNNILFVSGSGRVGIGTGTPNYTLDVLGPSEFVGNMLITGSVIISGSTTTGEGSYNTVPSTLYVKDSIAVFTDLDNTASISLKGSSTNRGMKGIYFYHNGRSAWIESPPNGGGDQGTLRFGSNGVNVLNLSTAAVFSIPVTATSYGGSAVNSGTHYYNFNSSELAVRIASTRLGSSGRGNLKFQLKVAGGDAADSDTFFYVPGTNKNISINSATTDLGATLGVRGSGTTDTTTAFRVENANASSSMVVLDNGNVGIGTTTDAGFKLDVNGTVRVKGNIDLADQKDRYIYGFGGSYIKFYDSGTGGLDIYNLSGTGTTRNYGSLAVYGNLSTTGSFSMNGNLNIGNGNFLAAEQLNVNRIYPYNGANANMRFVLGHPTIGDFDWEYPINTVLVRLKRNGNFLIGTTADAGFKLDVNGTGRFSGNVQITGSATNSLLVKGSGATSSTTALRIENANASSSMVVLDNGNVGIGTNNPAYTLDVTGYIQSSQGYKFTSSTSGQFTISGGQTYFDYDGDFRFRALPSYTTSLTLTSGSNVGIGTTTPAYKLDVSGSGNFTNNLTVTGSFTVVTGSTVEFQVNQTGVKIGNASTDSHSITGSIAISSSASTSSAALLIYKSGSSVLDIQGSQGQLFSVVDTLSGSLMSVNDVSGLPILEVFSDDRVVLGTYGAPALIITGSNAVFTGSVVIDGALLDTIRTGSLATGSTLIYTVNTGSYQAGFFDYYINSGSNFRAGNIMAVFGAGTYRFTDAATPDIGNTTNLQFSMSMAGASAQLFASASTAGWTVKTTFRTI